MKIILAEVDFFKRKIDDFAIEMNSAYEVTFLTFGYLTFGFRFHVLGQLPVTIGSWKDMSLVKKKLCLGTF